LKALGVVKYMTAAQLGEIVDPGKGKPFSIARHRKTHTYAPGYDDVIKLLPRMLKEGLVKGHPRQSEYEPRLWSLPGIKKPINPQFRQHYIDTTWYLAKYWPAQHWDEKWLEGEYDVARPMYDARMKKWDRVIYWETDRGTEEVQELHEKVDKYIALANSTQERFTVCFTMQYFRFGADQGEEQRHKKLVERSNDLLDYLASKKRGNQFLVAWHDNVVADPYGPVFVSPLDPSSASTLEALTAS
jgi:hypothetical protein